MGIVLSSLFLGSLLTIAAPTHDRGQKNGLLTRTVSVGSASYSYQVYIPTGLQRNQKPPVILFLHGIGQRGEGGFVPSQGNIGALARNYLEQLPAIVVLPQCRKNRYWSDPDMDQMVMATLNQTVVEFGGDAARLYLIGVSMGGYGAWHLASQHPGTFAAIVPVCGGSPLRGVDRYAPIARRVGQTPVWVFHGADDRIVPVAESRHMVEALKAVNGNVRYSEYEGVGHNVWLKALAEPELFPWLLAQHLVNQK